MKCRLLCAWFQCAWFIAWRFLLELPCFKPVSLKRQRKAAAVGIFRWSTIASTVVLLKIEVDGYAPCSKVTCTQLPCSKACNSLFLDINFDYGHKLLSNMYGGYFFFVVVQLYGNTCFNQTIVVCYSPSSYISEYFPQMYVCMFHAKLFSQVSFYPFPHLFTTLMFCKYRCGL